MTNKRISDLTSVSYRTDVQFLGLDTTRASGDQNVRVTGSSFFTGVTTNSNATAGQIGEYVVSEVVAASAASVTTNVAQNVTSVSLTAGDWDVEATVGWTLNAATVPVYLAAAINTTSATMPSDAKGGKVGIWTIQSAGATAWNLATGTTRISIAGTTTVYLVCIQTFNTNVASVYGLLRARRER